MIQVLTVAPQTAQVSPTATTRAIVMCCTTHQSALTAISTGWVPPVTTPVYMVLQTPTVQCVPVTRPAITGLAVTLSAPVMVSVIPGGLGTATVTPWSAGVEPTVKYLVKLSDLLATLNIVNIIHVFN